MPHKCNRSLLANPYSSVAYTLAAWLLSCTLSTTGLAADFYEIELIISQNIEGIHNDTEYWPQDPGLPDVTEAQAIASPGLRYGAIPSSQYKMTDEWQRLARSAQFRPLLHVAWWQPAPPNMRHARLLRIHSNASATTPSENKYEWEQTPTPTLYAPIDGTVKVTRGRFLHVALDLLFSTTQRNDQVALSNTEDPALTPTSVTSAYQNFTYRLHQTRRMRSKEIHYVDHPKFGVLILATPYKPAADAPATAEEEFNTGGSTPDQP